MNERIQLASWVALGLTGLLSSAAGRAQQVPALLHYQGVVSVDGQPFTGLGQFKFALISPDGTTTLWSNDGTGVAGAEPVAAVVREVNNGFYSLALGDVAIANMRPVPAAIFVSRPDLHLRLWFNDGVKGFQRLLPDRALGAVGYAMVAEKSAGLTAGAMIEPANIAAGAIDVGHLAAAGAPFPGQVLGFNGAGLTWINPAPGGGGDSVFSLNGANAYYNGGRVGIGTAIPSGALHVAGGGLAVTGESSPYFGAGKGVFIESNPTFGGHVFAFDYALGTPRSLMLNYPGGNVGIGTASPRTKLEVAAGWDQDFSANLTLSGDRPTMMWTQDGSGPGQFDTKHYWIAHMADGDLTYYKRRTQLTVPFEDTGWQERVRFTADGKVGIGTPIPSARLEVIGQNALQLVGYQPFMTLADSNAGYARARVQNVSGEIVWQTESFINGSNPHSFMRLESTGTVSVKTLTIRGGADLAEPFAMSEAGVVPGAVVVIDERNPGRLRRSSVAYDQKVAGIVSGAKGIRPGISMIQEDALEAGENVALSGRVYVNANTTAGAIEPGDLLTTSGVPGEAMKAADPERSRGAILGKAMTRLDEASGTVLVLVTLQ